MVLIILPKNLIRLAVKARPSIPVNIELGLGIFSIELIFGRELFSPILLGLM
jgi:hypothetical protein